jgi:signal transduction histidine kinase
MLGADAAQARTRVEAEVRGAFSAMTLELRDIARRAGDPADLLEAGRGVADGAANLFESAAAAVDANEVLDVAVTFYSINERPVAWSGRPNDIPADRLQDREEWFIASGERGLRLLYVGPVQLRGQRVGYVAAERPLSMLVRGRNASGRATECGDGEDFCFPTRLGPVAIQLPAQSGRTTHADAQFDVPALSGSRLLSVSIHAADLDLTRQRWSRAIRSIALIIVAATLLLLIAPILDLRNRATLASKYLSASLAAAALLVTGRVVLMSAAPADWSSVHLFSGATYASFVLPDFLPDRFLSSPFDFLLTTLMVAGLVALGVYAIEAWRVAQWRRRLSPDSAGRALTFLLTQVAAGVVVAALLLLYRSLLRDTIGTTTLDLVHFSIQPWDPSRTSLQLGLIAAAATVTATCVMLLRGATAIWRVPRHDWWFRLATLLCWCSPLVVWQTAAGMSFEQQVPLILAGAVVVAGALLATRLKTRYRHGSQAFRLTLIAVGLIVPAAAFYPALFQMAGAAKALLVETQYAAEALTQRERVKTQLSQALDDIDQSPILADLTLERNPRAAGPSTDHALLVWQETALALSPITSSLELYDRNNNLVSRFAYNLPEDLTDAPRSDEEHCEWGQPYGEVAPFFAEERQMLHAGRNICSEGDRGTKLGSIVVRAMLDYENLPFIASRTPYHELLRPAGAARADALGQTSDGSVYGRDDRDIEFVFYGWSYRPLYPTGEPAWQLSQPIVERLKESRTPFWQRLTRSGVDYNVYFQSDRAGIYALGFPVVTLLGHFVNLAELTVLAVGLFLLVFLVGALVAWIGRRRGTAPILLREIRDSFYRKLFLAFVAAVILPVASLALVTRNYVGDEMRAGIENEAIRTAATARRVTEDLVTEFNAPIDDKLMIWASRLVNQDVNVFSGPSLVATSERNLFASGSLPTRTPADVFWALQLRKDGAAVTHERVGTLGEYLVAATPLTARDNDAMLTVPLMSQQQEIEERIATLSRYLLLGALLFIFGGAAGGYWLAERISDPVNRLTRATRRISRGDLDARIVARSSDELRRLVEDFNRMASELQRQQKELERTHRVEAWAEMARQVAHEIKNPLTPIQLTAEHLRRVHADNGEPLGPVVNECVGAILTQVRLLRQIASEFSSFASSPTARRAVVSSSEMLNEIVSPYRIGLSDRIEFNIDVPDTLPPVHVDRTLVSRSITNIVENALHAMPKAGTLTVVATATDKDVRIAVTDTGAGMDPEALARAFEPYFSTKATGTGLGLPIARRNIELNGGTVAIDSVRDRGTTVTITLPIAA